jgi:hypothetical protein
VRSDASSRFEPSSPSYEATERSEVTASLAGELGSKSGIQESSCSQGDPSESSIEEQQVWTNPPRLPFDSQSTMDAMSPSTNSHGCGDGSQLKGAAKAAPLKDMTSSRHGIAPSETSFFFIF